MDGTIRWHIVSQLEMCGKYVEEDFNNFIIPGIYIFDTVQMPEPNSPFTGVGTLIVMRSMYDIHSECITQLAFGHQNILYFRIKHLDTWRDWQQIYPDYSSLSLALNGYIIFTNGLIIQWFNILIDAAVGAEFSQDDKWTQYRFYYNFNFPNNTYSNNIQLSGINWNEIDTSKILFNTRHTKNEYTISMPTNFINSGSAPKQLWCNVLVIGS